MSAGSSFGKSEHLVYDMCAPRLPKLWETADVLVRSIEVAISNWFWAPFEKQAVSAVCTELLENVLKYTDWGQAVRPSFHVQCYDDRRVVLRTTNVIDQSAGHYESFMRIYPRLQDESQAQRAYEERMQHIAELKRSPGEQTQLGLLRLVHENHCQIHAELRERDVLTVEVNLDLNWLWS